MTDKKITEVISCRKKNAHRFCGGYFTVEAALVYPFVIGGILLIIYVWFFMYDRCLMEQDYAGVMVCGAIQQELSPDERIEYIKEKVSNLYRKQYLCWNWTDTDVSIKNGKIEISVGGYLEFPFRGLDFRNSDSIWKADREYTGKTYDRAFIIRTFRKIEGIFE